MLTFKTSIKEIPIAFSEPEELNKEQLAYITSYINTFEAVLFGPKFDDAEVGYVKYLDVESFVNWYLINELTKNNDAAFISSVYMYKDRGQKLKMGPLWDYDIALGNINYNGNNDPAGWWIKESAWTKRLFEDPNFRSKVKERWKEVKQKDIDGIFERINQSAQYLKHSQKQNFQKWNTLYSNVWPNAVVLGTYENEVQYLKSWLNKRISWLDQEINKL